MSAIGPAWRLPLKCLSCRVPSQQYQRRTALFGRGSSNSNNDNASKDDNASSNPILDEYRRQNPDTSGGPPQIPEHMRKPGDIAATSIFEDERRIQEQRAQEAGEIVEDGKIEIAGTRRDPKVMARVLDPNPHARERWERKKVIQMVRKGGRMSKEQMIKRTEREHLVKSHNMKTSVKKLGMLARQIQGKTIDDAIVQMRFSKKRIAQEVLKQLEFARDEAVVMRGMGLGQSTGSTSETDLTTSLSDLSLDQQNTKSEPLEIQLKDGKRHRITDKSKIYIDQAWVGRGPYGQLPDYRARGRIYIMRTPWTSLSVVLKEEATRIREYGEREAKRQRKLKEKVWVQLPDRPIQTQRQWYSW